MEDTGMFNHLAPGRLPHLDDVFEEQNHVMESPSSDESSEGGLANAVLATALSSASTAHVISDRVIAVSLQLRMPAVPGLSGQLADIPGNMRPELGSVLGQSSRLLLDLSNSTAAGSNVTSVWSSEDIGAVVMISLIVPFILLSNIIVIVCVARYRRLRTPTNYFITSLAAVDIFVALATPFVVVVEVFKFTDVAGAGDVMLCLLPNRILMMGCGVSVLTLAAIAYDRHTALVSPLRYVNIMTARRVTIMVLLSWLYSVTIVWFPVMAGWFHVPSDVAPCTSNLMQGKAPLLFLGAIFVPSCVAIMICYFRILMVARQHVKAIAAFEFAVHRRVRVKCMMRETKCAKTLALIIGVFLALWLPYLTLIFMRTVSSIKFDIWLQTYLILLAVFNSGINPWMYAFMNSELRAAFKRLFREVCGDRLCAPADRRSSLVSVVSTPRLSLSDSRALSIIPETSLEVSQDPQAGRLDLCVDREPVSTWYRQRHHSFTQAGAISAASLFLGCRQPARPAASCSNLDTTGNVNTHSKRPLTQPGSVSPNVDLTRELALQSALDGDLTRELALQSALDGDLTRELALQSVQDGDLTRELALQSVQDGDLTRELALQSVQDGDLTRELALQSVQDGDLTMELALQSALDGDLNRPGFKQRMSVPISRCERSLQDMDPTTRPCDNIIILPTTSLTISSSMQHCISVIPHQPPQLPPVLPPSCPSGQAERDTSSPWPAPCTSAPAQQADQTSSSPSSSCRLHSTESNQGVIPQATLSSRPQPRPSPTTPQEVAPPDTCPAAAMADTHRPCPMYPSLTLTASPACAQASAGCRRCSLPQTAAPAAPANGQLCALLTQVPTYTFLLPLCETLALDVISTAARLENCIDLARLVGSDHRILIQ